MAERFECRQEFEDEAELVWHYRTKHIKGWWCWCGWEIDPSMDAWCAHIEREGGLIAHYLACHLEADHGK